LTNNPTCQVSTYVGGLACCRHGTFLLDAEQAVPEYVDRTFFRFRFYYEELQVRLPLIAIDCHCLPLIAIDCH